MCLASAAWWTVSLWLTLVPGVTLVFVFHASVVLTLLCTMVRPPRLVVPDISSIVQLVAVIGCSMIPFFARVAFGSGDMTMHQYLAAIVQIHQGIPSTHEPLLAIPQFGQYPIGFHLLTALTTSLTGWPLYRVALLLSCVTCQLLFLALLCGANDRWRTSTAFAAVFFCVCFSHYPLFLFQWGSATTALSLAFLFFLFPVLLQIEKLSLWQLVFSGMMLAAALSTQPIPFFGCLLYFPIAYLVLRGVPDRCVLGKVAVVGVACACFSAGLLLRLPPPPDAEAVQWARDWNLAQFFSVHPLVERVTRSAKLSVLDIPAVYAFIMGIFSTIIPTILVFFVRDRKTKYLYAAFLIVSVVVLYSKLIPILPLNSALYPERMIPFMALPIVAIYAVMLDALTVRRVGLVLALGFISIGTVGMLQRHAPFVSHYRMLKEKLIGPVHFAVLGMLGSDAVIYALDDSHSSVTRDDLAVMKWIRQNLSRDEVIDCDYTSGGHLIPIVVGNKILRPHYAFFWYKQYLKPWQDQQQVRYCYVGTGATKGDREHCASYGQELFRSGAAAVFGAAGVKVGKLGSVDRGELPRQCDGPPKNRNMREGDAQRSALAIIATSSSKETFGVHPSLVRALEAFPGSILISDGRKRVGSTRTIVFPVFRSYPHSSILHPFQAISNPLHRAAVSMKSRMECNSPVAKT